jgi:two-component system chemotaxis response regulator CheY
MAQPAAAADTVDGQIVSFGDVPPVPRPAKGVIAGEPTEHYTVNAETGKRRGQRSLGVLNLVTRGDTNRLLPRSLARYSWSDPARRRIAAPLASARGGGIATGVREEKEMLRKILAVDDSALIHQMYKLFLSRYKNCKLVSAMNGLEALDKLAQEEGIDLILLDINMPVMNGLEFLQRVQKEPAYQAIPVIIISTEGKEEDTIRGLKMGAKGYVKKPFQASELHGLIEKITSES